MSEMTHYQKHFYNLMDAGVPNWFIRNHLIPDLAEENTLFIYHSPYDVELESTYGWHAEPESYLNFSPNYRTLADIGRKSRGSITNFGFPTWDEYKILFDGDEFDNQEDYLSDYKRAKTEWWEKATK